MKFDYTGYFDFGFSVSVSYRFGSARLVGYDWFGSVGKKINGSIGYNRMLSPNCSYSFLAYYLLSVVAHLVLFTIPGISGGVPNVEPSSSVL